MNSFQQEKPSPVMKKYIQFIKNKKSHLDDFFQELNSVLECSNNHSIVDNQRLIDQISLSSELEEIQDRFENITVFINSSFDSIRVECEDIYKNNHFLIIDLDLKEKHYKITEHNLPELKELTCTFSNVFSAVDAFNRCLFNLEDYFEVMSDVDANCWIIDPAVCSFKDNYRRIVIGEETTALITIDVYSAKKPPSVRLLGPTKYTDPLLEKLHKTVNEWDEEKTFIDNLLYVLDLSQFPQKQYQQLDRLMQSSDLECSICLVSRDYSGLLPSVICEKSTCRQIFHTACLYQWLLAMSNNVQRFNTIHGECPSCLTPLSCPVPGCVN